jgi:hypothetical protein
MSTPTEHAEHTRPATKATWWLWIAASAAIPILGVLRDVTVTLAHCANPGILPQSDRYQTIGQFRTFDTATGNLVADFGRQSRDQDITQWSLAFDRTHGRFAGIGGTLGSKGGSLVVWDQTSGQELQRIETTAYRTGTFSRGGRWLALLGRDDNAIHFYRAEP